MISQASLSTACFVPSHTNHIWSVIFDYENFQYLLKIYPENSVIFSFIDFSLIFRLKRILNPLMVIISKNTSVEIV